MSSTAYHVCFIQDTKASFRILHCMCKSCLSLGEGGLHPNQDTLCNPYQDTQL